MVCEWYLSLKKLNSHTTLCYLKQDPPETDPKTISGPSSSGSAVLERGKRNSEMAPIPQEPRGRTSHFFTKENHYQQKCLLTTFTTLLQLRITR